VNTGFHSNPRTAAGTMIAHGWNHAFGGGKLPGTARWFESIGIRPVVEKLDLTDAAAAGEQASGVIVAAIVSVGGVDPQDPANASGLVVYLASDASSWLTGQVFRVHGSRVQRLRGWRAAGEYRSRSGGAVEPEELITGLPEVYGTAPAGRLPDPAVHGA
jgi:hypothetical protein